MTEGTAQGRALHALATGISSYHMKAEEFGQRMMTGRCPHGSKGKGIHLLVIASRGIVRVGLVLTFL